MADELSIFVDESGDRAGLSRYYLLTLVIHDQPKNIIEKVLKYEKSLLMKNLPNIPFHSEPLLNGRAEYRTLSIETRKKLLYSFNVLSQRLPISYKTFVYKRSEYSEPRMLSERMRRDVSSLLSENLDFFQKFDKVKVYYDNGQDIVKQAIDESLNSVLSAGVFFET